MSHTVHHCLSPSPSQKYKLRYFKVESEQYNGCMTKDNSLRVSPVESTPSKYVTVFSLSLILLFVCVFGNTGCHSRFRGNRVHAVSLPVGTWRTEEEEATRHPAGSHSQMSPPSYRQRGDCSARFT